MLYWYIRLTCAQACGFSPAARDISSLLKLSGTSPTFNYRKKRKNCDSQFCYSFCFDEAQIKFKLVVYLACVEGIFVVVNSY